MGLYSTNRVCGLAPEVFTEEAYDPSFGSIMETTIQICENDQKMFDSLIECDFLSAHTESTMLEEDATAALLEQDEAKKEGILQKIKDLIAAVIAAIKKAASNFIAKINNIISNDKKIYAKYEKNLTVENLNGFKGIKNYRPVKILLDKSDIENADINKTLNAFKNDFISKAESASDKDEIKSAYEDMKNKIKDNRSANDSIYFGDPVESFVPGNDYLGKIKSIVKSGSNIIKKIKDEVGKQIKALKETENEAKKAISTARKNKSGDLDVYKAKMVYDATSLVTKSYTHLFAEYTNLAARQLAAARKAFLICGKYCNKKANGENPAKEEDQATAEAVDFAVMESSDEYIFSVLGY